MDKQQMIKTICSSPPLLHYTSLILLLYVSMSTFPPQRVCYYQNLIKQAGVSVIHTSIPSGKLLGLKRQYRRSICLNTSLVRADGG